MDDQNKNPSTPDALPPPVQPANIATPGPASPTPPTPASATPASSPATGQPTPMVQTPAVVAATPNSQATKRAGKKLFIAGAATLIVIVGIVGFILVSHKQAPASNTSDASSNGQTEAAKASDRFVDDLTHNKPTDAHTLLSTETTLPEQYSTSDFAAAVLKLSNAITVQPKRTSIQMLSLQNSSTAPGAPAKVTACQAIYTATVQVPNNGASGALEIDVLLYDVNGTWSVASYHLSKDWPVTDTAHFSSN